MSRRRTYPLLIHPDDIGSRVALDPIEARACRRIKPSEIPADWAALLGEALGLVDRPLQHVEDGLSDVVRFGSRPARWFWCDDVPIIARGSGQDTHSAEVDLWRCSSVDDFKRWADRWLRVAAWVCEGDEPAPSREIVKPAPLRINTTGAARHRRNDFECIEAEPFWGWGLSAGWYWYEPEYPDEGGVGPFPSRDQAIANAGGCAQGDAIAVFEIKPEGDEP